MKRRAGRFGRAHLGLLTAGFVLLVQEAYANSGSPFLWAALFHLLVGNAFIGLLEGSLIAVAFKVRIERSIGILIAANYFSMIVPILIGIASASLSGDSGQVPEPEVVYAPITLPETIWTDIVSFYFFFGLLSFLLEAPVVYLIFRKKPKAIRKTLSAALFAQFVSYLALTPYYVYHSHAGLIAQTVRDESLSFLDAENYSLYYISNDDGDVYRQPLTADGEAKKIAQVGATSGDARLFLKLDAAAKTWDLWIRLSDSESMRVVEDVTKEPAIGGGGWRGWSQQEIEERDDGEFGTHMNFGPAADLRSEDARTWRVRTGLWPGEGMVVNHLETAESHRLSTDGIFGDRPIRNAYVLPGEVAVFQLVHEVWALELGTWKLGRVAWGRGPVVGKEERDSEAGDDNGAP